VIEALKALFNIILSYPQVTSDLENRNKWIKIFKVLEKQIDCSVNLAIFKYIELF
jgi:hypothetical protein